MAENEHMWFFPHPLPQRDNVALQGSVLCSHVTERFAIPRVRCHYLFRTCAVLYIEHFGQRTKDTIEIQDLKFLRHLWFHVV